MDAMSSPLAGLSPTTTLVMNHGYVTPRGTFHQVNARVSNTDTATFTDGFTLTYMLGGIDVSAAFSSIDFNVRSSADLVASWTLFIPSGSPADSDQIYIAFIGNVAGDVDFDVWTLPSTLFQDDFTFESMPRYGRPLMKQLREPVDKKMDSLHDDYVSVCEDDDDEKSVVSHLSMGPSSSTDLRRMMARPLAISAPKKISSTKSEPKSTRFDGTKGFEGEGPFKFNPALLEIWCLTALKSDISVRAKRTELVESAEKCEAKDGGFEVSSALYLRVFSFLRQARNPLDSTSLFSFNKALEELIKLVEKANEHVDLNGQHQA